MDQNGIVNKAGSMRWWKWTVRLGAGTLCATGVIGFLHLPIARPLLARLGACPVRATPGRTEAARRVALSRLRGAHPAPARPALGFSLETTTLADVQAWGRTRGIACQASMQDTLLKCESVPASAVTGASGAFDEVAFGFRLADHRLVAVTTISGGLEIGAAAARFTAIAETLEGAIGTSPAAKRLPTPAWDARGPVFVEYRYIDYIAGVSAMGMQGRGVVMREHYTSARDDRDPSRTQGNTQSH
jgi:hypothetical protein